MPRFHANQADIEIRLSEGADYTRFTNDEFDVDIVYGCSTQEGIVVLPLGEELCRRCVPQVCRTHSPPLGLAEHACSTATTSRFVGQIGSPENGMKAPPLHGLRFGRRFLAISVAVNGLLGIALGSTRLAEKEFEREMLAPILEERAKDFRYIGYLLVFPSLALRSLPLQIFRDWISKELAL